MNETIIIVLIYLSSMLVLSFLIKSANNLEDYSTAKRQLGIIAVAVGLTVTHFGGGFILGGAELSYKYGIYGFAYAFSAALGIFILGILSYRIYDKAKDNKIRTVSSFLSKQYKDEKIALIASVLSILALIGIASAQFFAAIKIFNLIGFSMELSSIFLLLIVSIVSKKGINALTSFGKYNILIALAGVIATIFIAGNIPDLPLQKVSYEQISFFGLLWIIIPTTLYTIIGQDLHQKVYSSKSKRIAKLACFTSAIILLILGVFPTIIGMQSRSLFNIDAYDAFPKFIAFTMPSIFKGLFIAVIIAAVIGSSQSVINAASTQFTEDILIKLRTMSKKIKIPADLERQGIFNPLTGNDDRGRALGHSTQFKKIEDCLAPLVAIIFSIVALLLAIYSDSIINNIILAYTLFTAGMFIPIIIAFFSSNPEKYSKIAFPVSIIGILISLVFELKLITIKIPSIIISILFSLLIFFIYGIVVFNKRLHRKTFINYNVHEK